MIYLKSDKNEEQKKGFKYNSSINYYNFSDTQHSINFWWEKKQRIFKLYKYG